MTREEIISAWKFVEDGLPFDAIESKDNRVDMHELIHSTIEALSAEPCDDCISRKSVIDVLTRNRVHFCDMVRITSELKELPSVTPGVAECEDAISRATAIKAMNDLEQEDIERYGCSIPEGFDATRAVEALKKLHPVTPKQKMGRWIPIKTRPLSDKEKEEYADLGYSEDSISFMYDCPLPDDGQEVLITTRYDEVTTDTFYRDEGCYFETYCDEDDVKAWMPLPEPYKAEKGGEE